MKATTFLLVGIAIAARAAAAQDAALVTTIGKDTLCFERYARHGNVITGSWVVMHPPGVYVHDYSITVGPDGLPVHYSMKFRVPTAATPPDLDSVVVEYGRDTVAYTFTSRSDSTLTRKVALHEAFPFLGQSLVGLDLALRRLRAAHADSGIIVTNETSNLVTPSRRLSVHLAGDSALLGAATHVQLTPTGGIVDLMDTRFVVRQAPSLDVAQLTKHFVDEFARSAAPRTAPAPGPENRQTRVEVTTPKPPTPVVVDGHRVLVYELHVTNFDARPLILQSVDVFGEPGLLADLHGSGLREAFEPIGGAKEDTLRLATGQRGVVYIWLTLPGEGAPPPRLRNRLTFAVADASAPGVTSVIDSLFTPVSRQPAPALSPPFRGGDWFAAEGPTNMSSHRRTLTALDGRAWISQRFAVDWNKIGSNGNTWHDDRSKNENYWGYGEPVLAMASGSVVAAVDSIANNERGHTPPISVANIAGNYAIVQIAPSQYVLYAHMQRGSVKVHVGQRLKRGDVIGLLGNSGQATAPHLHIQVMDAPSPLAAEGIPWLLEDFTYMGLGQDYDADKPHPMVPRHRELVPGDAVVRIVPSPR